MSTTVTDEKPMSFIPNPSDKKLIRMTAAEADVNMSELVRRIVRKFFRDHGVVDAKSATRDQILGAVQSLPDLSELTSE